MGLQPLDGSVVPDEASLIVEESGDGPDADGARGPRIAGRITSSRMSPTLRRSVCLAQVEAHLARPRTLVTVRLPTGREIQARVTPQLAHVDPDGRRTHA